MEGYSFRTAVGESNHTRGTRSWVSFVRTAKAPELPVVLLEDFAALVGLVFALIGVGLTLLTGNGIWDGVGTAFIGVLLVVVAVVLAIEMKSLLLGEAASAEQVRAITEALVGDGDSGVDSVIHLRTMHLGRRSCSSPPRSPWAPRTTATRSPPPSTRPSAGSGRRRRA